EVNPTGYVHPTFLYESIWCILGFIVLFIICQKARKFSGQLALCYGVWYGAERAVVEGLRTDSLYIANTNIRVSQLLSALLAVMCLVALIALTVKYTKHPKPIDGVDFFLEEELKKQKEGAADGAPSNTAQEDSQPASQENENKEV
ncbi:MAG: prolipoprotein diacylglyceryl transferase, partial [Clostridia bacterium]|nr:prolipoprotein diacylglyceryl transferase [Clostridia bacterium]